MLTAYVDEPARVTSAQMDRWARDSDNWAICDTLCFALWDRTPHAWAKVSQWSDKVAGDERFAQGLLLIERPATDSRIHSRSRAPCSTSATPSEVFPAHGVSPPP